MYALDTEGEMLLIVSAKPAHLMELHGRVSSPRSRIEKSWFQEEPGLHQEDLDRQLWCEVHV